MHFSILNKKNIFLFIFIIVISFILIILLRNTYILQKNLEDKILDLSTTDIISISKNSAKSINELLSSSDNYIESILNDENLQKQIEKSLTVLITKNIKYSYIVYKDNEDTFRFLVDASPEPDKAMPNQKFAIDNDIWFKIYETKKPELIEQSKLKELSITYLIPILEKDEVKLILAIDFSITKSKDINELIDVIKNAVYAIISVIFLFVCISIVQVIKYKMIKRSVYIDRLTEVYNRNYLVEYESFINLNDYIIATIDIDHFKKINDTYGHIVGDKVLKTIASIIKTSSRQKDDIVIRYGGEEFLIFIKTRRINQVQALNVIDRIFQNVKKENILINESETINITISIGINLNPNNSRTLQEAFKLADIALYNAKNRGRDRIEIYSEQKDDTSFHLSVNEIKEAIEEKRIRCFFQKIVSNEDKTISHYEALLRIMDKNGNIITPDRILPTIKGTFLSRNITKQVLKICYKELQENPNIHININLTSQDIVNDSIISILNKYALEDTISDRLGLEIVENEDIINYEHAKNNLLLLKEVGYKIFIDDFGSGYSNFIYLTEIQSDFIKIDGNIIRKILTDKTSYLVIKCIIDFAKVAKIKTIAEYVSNEEIYLKVKEMGIDYSQGFYFGKPSENIKEIEENKNNDDEK